MMSAATVPIAATPITERITMRAVLLFLSGSGSAVVAEVVVASVVEAVACFSIIGIYSD